MAVNRRGSILGDLSGKIGTVVVYRYRNLDLGRSTPRKVMETSAAQADQRCLFGGVSEFFSLVNLNVSVFERGYQLRLKEHFTAYNAAISYHVKHAVVGEYPNYQIDISKLRFSRSIRSTENGYRLNFTASEGRKAEISWELNPYREKTTQLDDKAVIVFYYTKANERIEVISADVRRSALQYNQLFSDRLVGEDLHCWVFFTSANGKLVSETEYLGAIKIMA